MFLFCRYSLFSLAQNYIMKAEEVNQAINQNNELNDTKKECNRDVVNCRFR